MTPQTSDSFIRLAASVEELVRAIESASGSLAAFCRVVGALEGGAQFGPMLSVAGREVFLVATWLGFCALDVLAWLETCPGAYERDFGEGWRRA